MKRIILKRYLFLMLFLMSISTLYAQNSNYFRILFTGNTSDGTIDTKLLGQWNSSAHDEETEALLMLGNIYSPKSQHFSEELYSDTNIPLLMVPGEKEWSNGGTYGKTLVQDLGKKLKKEYKGTFFTPEPGCPGPKEVIINDHLVLILLDSHWWVHKYDRRFARCGIESNSDVIMQIEDAIKRHYSSKHIVIAAHHSLKSFGNSDGYFSIKQITLQAPYVFYRKVLGARTDNHHPDYKNFRNGMLNILEKYPNLIYVSAGDQNLQYFTDSNTHFIVSGSFTKTKYAKSGKAKYASAEKGFGQLIFSNTGDCELVFTGAKGRLYKQTIYQRRFESENTLSIPRVEYQDSIIVKASERYNKSPKTYFWLGKNYREVWNTPVKVAVFDIGTKKGGLQIIDRGGGQQTFSLRLEAKDGKQYVLRSIDKEVEGALPNELKNTLAKNIVQDQVSASNPYAAMVVAKLAESAQLLHSNPEIVFVPDDFRFGIYKNDVANKLFLFEERLQGNQIEMPNFGHTSEIISTDEVLKRMEDKRNHIVDVSSVIRARLFDILINDWDRHDDQWRWAKFKSGDRFIYKPIPRDRDQAFFVNEGVFPWIAARNWILPKIHGFDEYTENVAGQYAYATRYFDQTFLINADWIVWENEINSLQTLLKPERIDAAVQAFPSEIQPLCAGKTAEILKSRLKNLKAMARQLYVSLAKEVSITGTNNTDFFTLNIINDTTLQLLNSYQSKEMNQKTELYNRVFYAGETKLIHIFGHEKDDKFNVSGSHHNKIRVKISGDEGDDQIIFENKESPLFLSIYDKKSTDVSHSLKSRIHTQFDKEQLEYNREAFEYDVVYPLAAFGFNQDDGIFLGGGARIKKNSHHHFQDYRLLSNYAFDTKSFYFLFEGSHFFPLNHLDITYKTYFKGPRFTYNFFGMGNETQWLVEPSEKDYYRLRLSEYFAGTEIFNLLNKNDIHKIGIGMFYKCSEVHLSENRFISDYTLNNLTPSEMNMHSFAGLSGRYQMNTLLLEDQKKEAKFGGSTLFLTRGMQLDAEISHYIGLNSQTESFTKISSNWSSYLSFSQRPRIVYVFKVGGEKLFGNYPFYEAAKLGQHENLRGYRLTRFYGDASFYLNTEIRIRGKQFNSYVMNGTAGLLLFNDLGRVWLKNENSSKWHNGYGFGLWVSPFDMALFSISFAKSKEDKLINFTLNYQF